MIRVLMSIEVTHQESLAHRARAALGLRRQGPLQRSSERGLLLYLRLRSIVDLVGHGWPRPHAISINMFQSLSILTTSVQFKPSLGERCRGRFRRCAPEAGTETWTVVISIGNRGGSMPRVAKLTVQLSEWCLTCCATCTVSIR